jgi:hypothetical protein
MRQWSQIAALASALQVCKTLLQSEGVRLGTMAADPAMVAEVTENAALLESGELTRARAALATRTQPTSTLLADEAARIVSGR